MAATTNPSQPPAGKPVPVAVQLASPPKPIVTGIYMTATKSNTDHMIGVGLAHLGITTGVLGLVWLLEWAIIDVLAWWFYAIADVALTAIWISSDLIPKKLGHARIYLSNGTRQVPGSGAQQAPGQQTPGQPTVPIDYYGGEGNDLGLTVGNWELIGVEHIDVRRRTHEFPEPISQQLGALEEMVKAITPGQPKVQTVQMGIFLADFYLSFEASVTDPCYLNYEPEQALNQVRLTILGLIRDVALFMEGMLKQTKKGRPKIISGFSVIDKRKLVQDIVWILLNQDAAHARIAPTGITVWSITLRKIVVDKDIAKAGEEKSQAELQGRAQQEIAKNFAAMIQTMAAGIAGKDETGRQFEPNGFEKAVAAVLSYMATREAIYQDPSGKQPKK